MFYIYGNFIKIIIEKMNSEGIIKKTLTLTKEQSQILSTYKDLGFNNESELLNYAIMLFQKEIRKLNELKLSADLYSEIYNNDLDLQDLTQTAFSDIDL